MGFQIMLDQANCFYICAKLCESKMKKFLNLNFIIEDIWIALLRRER